MATRDDESREDKESRDEEGTATEGSGDDERSADAYEFSGGESSGKGDGGSDDANDSDDSADDRSDDEEAEGSGGSRDDGPTGREADSPSYDFSGGESSGENADPSAHEDDDQRSKMPVTAATTQWHPSREDQKKARRIEREQNAAEAERDAKRKKRLKLLGAAVAAALVIVLIVIGISSLGGEKATSAGSGDVKGPAVGSNAVKERFAGIPQDGLALGDPKAPVTLVEFADLQCPFCKDASNNTLPALVDRYVKEGKLRIEFRNFPILGPDSDKAARALEGAADQNKAWQFIDLWFLNQGEENSGYVTDAFIRKIAQGAGLDADAVVAASNDMGDAETTALANTEAQKFGIQSTPSYLIGRTGEEPQQLQIQDPNNPDLFAQAIDRIAGQQE